MPTQGLDTRLLSKTQPKIKVEGECPCCDEPVEVELCELVLAMELGHRDCGEQKMQAIVWNDAEVRDIEELEAEGLVVEDG